MMSSLIASNSCTAPTSGTMISTRGTLPALCSSAAASRIARTCISNSPGMTRPSRTPRRPSIGFCSCSLCTACSIRRSPSRGLAAGLGHRDPDRQLGEVGQELVQRRVEQPDRHRQPVHRLEDAVEVLALQRQQFGQLASRSSSVSARISPSTSDRRSPRNMCSVRHSPMPCAPNRRARAESSPVSALARTSIRRAPSAHLHQPVHRLDQLVGVRGLGVQLALEVLDHRRGDHRHLAEEHLAGGAVDGDHGALRCTEPSLSVKCRALVSTSIASAPQTQVLPMPRATTAAWLVLPPRLVRMPWAAIMPSRSSGLVSRRTRMTRSPDRDHLIAV